MRNASIPCCWKEQGSFKGLVARGGYVVDCEWRNGIVTRAVIESRKNNNCRIKIDNPNSYIVKGAEHHSIDNEYLSIFFDKKAKITIEKA